MATAHVQSFGSDSGVGLSVTGVTSGNAFGLIIGWVSSTITLTSITCDKSGTITLVNNPTSIPLNGVRAAMAYGVFNASGTATFTLNWSTEPSWFAAGSEVSGVNTTTPFDASALRDQYNLTGADSNTSGTASVSDGAYIAGFCWDANASGGKSVGTGFTLRRSEASAGQTTVESLVQSGAASRESKFGMTVAFQELAVGMLALKAAAGGDVYSGRGVGRGIARGVMR